MNPVHTLGPAVAAGNYTVIWVYLLAPPVGALAGAGTLVKLQIGEEVELLLAEVWALLLVREQALLLVLLLCHFSYALTYKVRDKFTKDILYDKQYQLCLKEIQN